MLTKARNVEEQMSACKGLWMLAFNNKNKEIMRKTSGLVETMNDLRVSFLLTWNVTKWKDVFNQQLRSM